jgi:outer membrane protein OmpA-like peptidoglycan-associated protein
MSEIKNSKITLIGCNSNLNKEKNNLKLSLSRAEAVKQYLIEVWKIDKTRIKTIARNLPEKASNISDPDGIAENRRVEIISDSWDITSPVIIEDTLRFIRPGGILIKNDVYSQIPIQNWEFNISSKNEEILKFSGSGNPDESLEIDFTKRDIFKSKLGNEISAYLKVMNEDETGISDIKKLPIEIITKDSSINVYNMILFDFNKADLSKQNQKIADYINNDLQDKADVKIIGFTDRIGEEEYNRKLSEERARATASSLKTKNIEIEGIGEKELLFDNTTPEGRFYSRTVEVQIRQETKEEKPNGK